MELHGPYPAIDKPLPLASGGVVQLYNLIVFVPRSGSKTLSIQYGTSLSSDAGDLLVREAEAVATELGQFADRQGITRASAQICRTRRQAETREAIAEIISLERGSDGLWHATDTSGLPEHGA